MFCGACGTSNADANRFCTSCGKEIVIAKAMAASASQGSSIPAPAPTQVPTTPTQPLHPELEKLRGIGGWLLLFCFGTTIGSPAVIASEMTTLNDPFGLFLDGTLALFSLAVGLVVWTKRPLAFKLLKPYFITVFVLGALAMIGTIMESSSNLSQSDTQDLAQFFRMMIFSAIWWSYFRKSKRVFATFGRNL
jgi:hypothetical protein